MGIPAFPFGVLCETAWIGNGYIENPQTIADHLRNRRLELGTTQAKVAKMLGVSEDTVTYWENERSKPQIQFFPKIIQFLGYNPSPVDTITLAGRMKKYRLEHGLSQKDLATLSGLDESSICIWEKNEKQPLPSKRVIIEEILNKKELSK